MAALIYSIKGEKSACTRLHLCSEVRGAGPVFRPFIVQLLLLTVPNHGLGGHGAGRSFNQLPKKVHCHGGGLTGCVNQYR